MLGDNVIYRQLEFVIFKEAKDTIFHCPKLLKSSGYQEEVM